MRIRVAIHAFDMHIAQHTHLTNSTCLCYTISRTNEKDNTLLKTVTSTRVDQYHYYGAFANNGNWKSSLLSKLFKHSKFKRNLFYTLVHNLRMKRTTE